MNTSAALRDRRLRALDVMPLHRHAAVATTETAAVESVVSAVPVTQAAAVAVRISRLALQPDQTELREPVLHKMYMALTEAIGKAGLQPVRVCDVAGDPSAAVMVFGAAPLPEGVPALRVLRADPLAVLHADRERKRQLWERMQALGRDGA